MRKFLFLAVATAAFAFVAPTTAHAQVVVDPSSSYFGGDPTSYDPFGYGCSFRDFLYVSV